MRTVLVVDDEFGIVDVLATALEDEGYRVFTAPNGRRGLERLRENPADLVILDFMMPLMNGAAMGKELRADPDYRDLPIIMISAVSETAVRARFDGYQAFLRKPFRIAAMLEQVSVVLGPAPEEPTR